MLDFAIKYKEKLQPMFVDTWYKEKYKYYQYATYCNIPEFKDSTWEFHDFVSLDTKGNIIGNFYYRVDRITENVSNLGIINFGGNETIFAKDLLQVIRDIFEKFNFNKLSFSVVIGNPAEKGYDKLIQKYNGRIVGIKEKEAKLFDGKFYDVKLYEILKENYLRSKNK